jgi:hypothetical protein
MLLQHRAQQLHSPTHNRKQDVKQPMIRAEAKLMVTNPGAPANGNRNKTVHSSNGTKAEAPSNGIGLEILSSSRSNGVKSELPNNGVRIGVRNSSNSSSAGQQRHRLSEKAT